MKKGFTLAELLITIVILAVLAGIGLPNFEKASLKAKANVAVATLRVIRSAEQAYFAKNGTYFDADVNALKTILGADVSTADYSFAVTDASATAFWAKALKGAAPDNTTSCLGAPDVICVNESGGWQENSAYVDALKL